MDAVTERKDQKEVLGRILRYHVKQNRRVHMGRDTIFLEERDRQIQAYKQAKDRQENSDKGSAW